MYFRNFSINVKKNIAEYGTSENTAYPVLALWTAANGKKMGSNITDADNTYVLIANDTFALRWVPASVCEQVDLT